MTSSFPFYEWSGEHKAIGHQHGETRRESIEHTLDLYLSHFSRFQPRLSRLKDSALYALYTLSTHAPHLLPELQAIAQAANQPAWKIGLLNARTEILNQISVPEEAPQECSSFYIPELGVVAQNWDWLPEFLDLACIAKITPTDGTQTLMLLEPGMLGKIGINSVGIGACLNILYSPTSAQYSLPIHVHLRQLQECTSLAQCDAYAQSQHDIASNIMLGDSQGDYRNYEYHTNGVHTISYEHTPIHTNHYLDNPNDPAIDITHSLSRYQRLESLCQATTTWNIDRVKAYLADKESTPHSICRAPEAGQRFTTATIASLICDCRGRCLHVAKGHDENRSYVCYTLDG